MSDAKSALDPTSAADGLLSRRLLILANALRRAAGLRYRRLLDLRQNEWSIVAELGARAPRTLNDIATSLNLDKAQMSRSVATLVERGFVLRRPNPQDSREVLLQFSAKGRACYAKLLAAGRDANLHLLSSFSTTEREMLAAQVETLLLRASELLQAERAAASCDDSDNEPALARRPSR